MRRPSWLRVWPANRGCINCRRGASLPWYVRQRRAMQHLFLGLLLPSAVAIAQHDASAAPSVARADPDLQQLEARLLAMDAQIESLTLRYSSTLDAAERNTVVGDEQVEYGIQYWTRDFEIVLAVSGRRNTSPTLFCDSWDHAVSRCVSAPFDWSSVGDALSGHLPAPTLLRIGSERSDGQLADWEVPTNLGLHFVGIPWSRYLSRLSEKQIIDRRDVQGVACLVLQGDMDGAAEDNLTTFPWTIAFAAGGAPLAMQVESFIDGKHLDDPTREQRAKSGRILRLGDRLWYRNAFIEVAEPRALAQGVSIGTKARLGYDEHPELDRTVQLDLAASCANQPAPDWLTSQSIADGVHVIDVRRGVEYYAGHEGDAEYEAFRRLQDIMASVDQSTSERWAAVTKPSRHLIEMQDELLLLYSWTWLGGGAVNTAEAEAAFKSSLDVYRHETESVAISAALTGLGLRATTTSVDQISVGDARWHLARTKVDSNATPTFALFRRSHRDAAQVFHPRRGAYHAKWTDFAGTIEPRVAAIALSGVGVVEASALKVPTGPTPPGDSEAATSTQNGARATHERDSGKLGAGSRSRRVVTVVSGLGALVVLFGLYVLARRRAQ